MSKFDYILFDLGAGATESSMSFVLASDECIVITTPEPTSITDAYSIIKHIVTKQHNMPISVIMNRCESRKEGDLVSERFHEVVNRFMQTDIRKMGILPNDKIVSTAVIRQTPYVLLNKHAPVSKAIQKIVADYIKQTTSVKEVKRGSFVQRLRKFLIRE